MLAQHGEAGAVNVVARPAAMRLVAQHGEGAAAVLVKHAGVAEPVVESFGAPAVRALAATGPQAGRRLAMLTAEGDLAKIGRTPELLDVIARYGDRAAAFVWANKGALAVGTTLTAFLLKPEAFISGAEKLAGTVAENAVRPLAEVPGKVADKAAERVADNVTKDVNWTAVFIVIVLAAGRGGRPAPASLLTACEKFSGIDGSKIAMSANDSASGGFGQGFGCVFGVVAARCHSCSSCCGVATSSSHPVQPATAPEIASCAAAMARERSSATA